MSDIESLLDKLDSLRVRLNTIVTNQQLIFKLIIPKLIEELRDYNCVFHSVHYNHETETVRIQFSYNDNKTCVVIVIELHRIREDIVRLKSHFYIQGSSCDFKL